MADYNFNKRTEGWVTYNTDHLRESDLKYVQYKIKVNKLEGKIPEEGFLGGSL